MSVVHGCAKMKLVVVLFILCAVNDSYGADLRVDPLVLIEQGLVRGLKSSDGSYSSFLGIPYAQVDSANPFGPAQEHPGFDEEIYNAYDGSIKCPQSQISPYRHLRATKNDDETLDCLRLNIYVPGKASSQNPLPVLVWIHGGVFAYGNGGEQAAVNLIKHGIVVVTINYRLGPYGFMCLDVPSVPGNQGLKDQYAALQWIRKNIGAFGGNPYNVTIGGQSAGASSVVLQLYSNKDKLFNKVIVQSGTPLSDGMFVNGDVTSAIKLASHLGFNTTDTEEALQFLSITSPHLVTAAATDLNLHLVPCRERSFSGIENFVDNDPISLSNEKKIRNTPILIGHTSKEEINSVDTYADYLSVDPFYRRLSRNFNFEPEQLQEATDIVRHFYIGDAALSLDLTSEFEIFESDFIFNHPTQRVIAKLIDENANPIYEYEFKYVTDPEASGARHSDELKYLFGMPDLKLTEEEQLLSKRITKLWSNFVKYGNPTPETTDFIPVIWTPVTEDTRPYLAIDTNLEIQSRLNHERMAFWDLFYSFYGKYSKLTRECQF